MEVEGARPDDITVKLGLCQIYSEDWAIDDNERRTLDAIQSAADQGAEIAITPELVWLGYLRHASPEDVARLYLAAEPLDGPRLGRVRELARTCGIYVLLGFAERDPNGSIRNSAALISPQGELVYVYRKVHCRDFEDARYGHFFVAGDAFHVAPLPLEGGIVRVGTMICFDREIPESVRCLRSLGAELVLCPLATPTYDLYQWNQHTDNELITRARAAENEVFIAIVNQVGGPFNGGSYVVGPRGEPLYQMDHKPGVCVIAVPVGVVLRHYHSHPLGWMGWGFRRPDVYDKYIGQRAGDAVE